MAESHPLSWLSNVPLYVSVYMHPSLSAHLLMDTRVAPTLATVNSAAMNVGVRLFTLEFSFFLDTCLGVELLDHIIVLFLVF